MFSVMSGNGVNLTASTDTPDDADIVDGSDSKLLMCGNLAYSALSSFANSAQAGFRILNNDDDHRFGLNLTEIQTPFGKASLAMHPLMKNDLNYQSYIVAADLALLTLKRITSSPEYRSGNDVKISRRSVRAVVVASRLCARHDRLTRHLFGFAARGLPLTSLGAEALAP
jgi:hypothetical protein